MITRLRCRLIGHKWVLQEGITALTPEPGHERDVLYECSRCAVSEWRRAVPEMRVPEPLKLA
jgi:hypothetical protein